MTIEADVSDAPTTVQIQTSYTTTSFRRCQEFQNFLQRIMMQDRSKITHTQDDLRKPDLQETGPQICKPKMFYHSVLISLRSIRSNIAKFAKL